MRYFMENDENMEVFENFKVKTLILEGVMAVLMKKQQKQSKNKK